MREPSPLSAGDAVTTLTKVGVMGATGNVTGTHLHLEYSKVYWWDNTYQNFLNPSDALGIPNVRGTIVHYTAPTPPEPEPPTPEVLKKKHRFNWQTFTKNIRNRRNLTNRI